MELSDLQRRLDMANGRSIRASYELTVHIQPDSIDGGYSASVLELPGCVTQGSTEAEVLENLKEAVELYLSVNLVAAEVDIDTISYAPNASGTRDDDLHAAVELEAIPA